MTQAAHAYGEDMTHKLGASQISLRRSTALIFWPEILDHQHGRYDKSWLDRISTAVATISQL